MLGAEVQGVASGTATLKDAVDEAFKEYVRRVEDTFYVVGSVVGPHPYPLMVREFQKVIGEEAKTQILEAEGRLPNYLIGCIGGGSNAIESSHALGYAALAVPKMKKEEVVLINLSGRGDKDVNTAYIYILWIKNNCNIVIIKRSRLSFY